MNTITRLPAGHPLALHGGGGPASHPAFLFLLILVLVVVGFGVVRVVGRRHPAGRPDRSVKPPKRPEPPLPSSERWAHGPTKRFDGNVAVDGLRKRFGSTQALDGMTFTVHPGQVTGFVGPNGAGKSTTMRAIVGLDAPDAGTATIGGHEYRTLKDPLSHVGSLLDAAALQPSRTARNHLLWLAHSQGLKAGRVDEVIALTGLGSAARRKAGGYSLGMRQRLGIAAALLGDPAVLIFDEPFNGMDPEGIIWMRGFLRTLADQGRAVLVSSHLMSELEDTAGHVVVVGRGRVIADTSVADLVAAASGNRITLRTIAPADAMTVLASAGAEVTATGSGVLTIAGLTSEKTVAILTSRAVPFSEVTAHRATLEQAYMELTSQSVEYRAEATS
jgi:ABC-2 type transport system ATP-binding protein